MNTFSDPRFAAPHLRRIDPDAGTISVLNRTADGVDDVSIHELIDALLDVKRRAESRLAVLRTQPHADN